MITFIDWIWAIICPLLAYLIGSIPFSYLITKWRSGVDLRESGNKNVGGLNAMMSIGFGWGIFAGFLDYSKGLICQITVMMINFNNEPLIAGGTYWELSIKKIIYVIITVAVLFGHNYPIFLNFQGGRGIAATVGILIVGNPLLLIVFVVAQAIFTFITKYVRPSQLLALIVGVPIAFFLDFFPPWIIRNGLDSPFILGLLVTGISIAILPKTLRSFIDMFKGKEYRVGKKGIVLPDDEETTQ
ncbi:MAG: glycerol-3-phosphate acyltransferase [Asgard group archaeon]|nr:glycerol-3-phosphate acyltransferase [Asgard group archaeon]